MVSTGRMGRDLGVIPGPAISLVAVSRGFTVSRPSLIKVDPIPVG